MKELEGNLVDYFLSGHFDVIIHGCNCFAIMGAGIAAEIATKIPEARIADAEYMVKHDINKLGNYSSCWVRRKTDDGYTVGSVINLYTQYHPGPYLDKNALLLGFTKLSQVIDTNIRIGIPAIGCGIAGGNWRTIGPHIARIMEKHDITYVKYNNNLNEDVKEEN